MSFPSEPTGYQQVGPQTFRAPKKSRIPLIAAWSVFGVLAVAVGAGVVVALNRSSEPKSAAAQPPATAARSAAPAPSPPSPTAAAIPEAGQTVTFTSGGKATAYRWQQPVAKKESKPSEFNYPANYVWGALDVQVCLPPDAPDDFSVSAWPWTVTYADNSSVEPADITGMTGWPKPQYPLVDRKIPAGSCLRGWITFAVPAEVKPTGALYAPSDLPATRWTLS